MLRPAFDPHDTHYVTTLLESAELHGIQGASVLPDCNLNEPVQAAHCLLSTIRLVIRHRPDVVISTGAAPGFFCILIGRMIGAKTLWIDSVANAEKLSLSGRLAARVSDQCLTQWKHLAGDPGPVFAGSIL